MSFIEWLIALTTDESTPPPASLDIEAVLRTGWIIKTDAGWMPTKAALKAAEG